MDNTPVEAQRIDFLPQLRFFNQCCDSGTPSIAKRIIFSEISGNLSAGSSPNKIVTVLRSILSRAFVFSQHSFGDNYFVLSFFNSTHTQTSYVSNTVFLRLELLNNKMNPIKFSCLRKLRQLPALSCSVCCFHGTGDATSTLMAQTAKNMTTRMVYFHKSLLSQKFSN